MTPRTKEQNEEIRLRRLAQIRKAAADVFLDKGLALEIRDVAAQAGLGYGTVYHYYSNKGDLLHDLLWAAMDQAGAWLDGLSGSGRASAGDDPANALGFRSVSAGDDPPNAADSRSTSGADDSPNAADVRSAAAGDPFVAAGVRLLEKWAEDHGLYLLYKLAVEGFRLLPEARAVPLAAAFRREVLLPFAAALGRGFSLPGAGAAASAENAPEQQVQQAEMLLAALAGCALLPLRRGSLRGAAGEIARFLLFRLTDRTRLPIEGVKHT